MLVDYLTQQNFRIMIYKTNQDLPLEIRTRLSEAAQDLYRAAYNSTIQWYGEAKKAHQVASRAVRMKLARDLSVLV
jgi:cation transport regulator